jgi:hypothetical protein
VNITVARNKEGYLKMKEHLIKVYGQDMELFNNMSIYTPEWATILKSPEQADNGFKADNLDEWVDKLMNLLENVPFAVFLDHVKHDGANIKRELTVDFI